MHIVGARLRKFQGPIRDSNLGPNKAESRILFTKPQNFSNISLKRLSMWYPTGLFLKGGKK